MTLVQFSFGNFRSFKETVTLSLVAASKLQGDPDLDWGNVFQARERPSLNLLRVGAIYGANASGKSNVVRAFGAFKRCILESANIGFQYTPPFFRLDTTSHEQPTFFEITFLRATEEHSAVQYRYGFEVQKKAEQVEITAEWLYEARTTTEALLFERDGLVVKHGRHFGEGKALLTEKKLGRADALFLSLMAQLGSPIASALVAYLRKNVNIVLGISDEGLHDFTVHCLEEDKHCDRIQSLMREADTGIPRVKLTKDPVEVKMEFPESMPEELRERFSQSIRDGLRVVAEHPVFDGQGVQVGVADFPLTSEESQGTQKLFAYSGPILDTLERGSTLIVDEMDARFHPLLTQALVRLFQSPETNPKDAQMVFIAHDTNLLDSRRLRRDQIWFVEKDRYGASHLYALSDFKGIRKGDLFEEQYIRGRYGAIPFLGGLRRLLTDVPDAEPTVNLTFGEANVPA
jgi:hypothetical protein